MLGRPGTEYPTSARTLDIFAGGRPDSFTVSSNMRTLSVNLRGTGGVKQLRVVTLAGQTTRVRSSFDADVEDWVVVGDDQPLQHVTSGGNPGGFVSAVDTTEGAFAFHQGCGVTEFCPANVVGELPFQGDHSAAYGGTLQ